MNLLIGQHLFSGAVNIKEKEKETWKVQCERTQWEVQYIIYGKYMEINIAIFSLKNRYCSSSVMLSLVSQPGFISKLFFTVDSK